MLQLPDCQAKTHFFSKKLIWNDFCLVILYNCQAKGFLLRQFGFYFFRLKVFLRKNLLPYDNASTRFISTSLTVRLKYKSAKFQ